MMNSLFHIFVGSIVLLAEFSCQPKTNNNVAKSNRIKQHQLNLKSSENSSLLPAKEESDNIVINVKQLAELFPKSTDTELIQKAIDSVWGLGGGTVYLAGGTYIIENPKGENNALIIPRSNVTLRGEGAKTVLKVKANTFKYNVIYPPTDSDDYFVENARFISFVVDGNGEYNILPKRKGTNKGAAIGIRHGENIFLYDITVRNSIGRQCFLFGSNQMPFSVQGLNIIKCHINNVGSAAASNFQINDHSSMYVQAKRVIIDSCEFNNYKLAKEATAIELHCSDCVVKNNTVNNFFKAVNVVSTVTDMQNVHIYKNTFSNIGKAFNFHTWPDFNREMDNVFIDSNTINQVINANTPLIDLNSKVKTQIGSLRIKGNTFICAKQDKSTSTGISVGLIQHLDVQGNKFFNIPSSVIELKRKNLDAKIININENIFSNCTLKSRSKNVVDLSSKGRIDELKIHGNYFSKDIIGIEPAGYAIYGNISGGSTDIQGNNYDNITERVIWNGKQGEKVLIK